MTINICKIKSFIFLTSLIVLPVYLFSLRITPQRYEIFLAHNEEQEIKFYVLNDRDFEQEIEILSRPWHVLKENKNIETNQWFSFSPQKLFLKPQEEGVVLCKVKSPEGAVGFLNNVLSFAEGYKYGGMVSLIISVPVYVIIKDNSYFNFEISSFVFRNNPVSKKDEFLVEIKNVGNVYIRPKGNLEVYKGKKIFYTKDFPELSPIFPEEKNFVFVSYEENKKLSNGKYKVVLTLNIWDKVIKKEKDFVYKNGIFVLK
jgi:hypothetical protein